MASLQMQVASEMAHSTKRLSLISTRARTMCFALLASMFFWVSTIREHVTFTTRKKTLRKKKANFSGVLHGDRVIKSSYSLSSAHSIHQQHCYRTVVKERFQK